MSTTPALPSHLALAICALLCFWPLGIPAIVNAAKVDRLYASRDIGAAERASYAARYWSKWALGVALVLMIISSTR